MGSKGINFSRSLSGSWDLTPPIEVEPAVDSPASLRATARKLEASLDSLQEQHCEYVHQLKEATDVTSSSLTTEISLALEEVRRSRIIRSFALMAC